MKVRADERLSKSNPFLHLGVVISETYVGPTFLYDIALLEDGSVKGILRQVPYLQNLLDQKRLKPLTSIISLKDKVGVKEIESKLSGARFKDLSKVIQHLFVSKDGFPDCSLVVVGFIDGKSPIILGEVPFYSTAEKVISDKKITRFWESENIRYVRKHDKDDSEIEINIDNNLKLKLDGNKDIKINCNFPSTELKIDTSSKKIEYSDNSITIKIDNGKIEITANSEVKIISNSNVLIDGNPTIKLGGDAASMNVNNLPNCLFTGAPHSTQMKVKVP